MPISAPPAGTDAAAAFAPAFAPGAPAAAGGRSWLSLDDSGSEHGRAGIARQRAFDGELVAAQAAAQAATQAATPAAIASAADPAMAQSGYLGPAGPGQAILPPGDALQGIDALAALRADLAAGALSHSGLAHDSPDAGAPDAGATGGDPDPLPAAAEEAQPRRAGPERDKGRRLGDGPLTPAAAESGVESWLFGADGFGFDDLIDVINPLQHIPIVSSIYRWITGDEIGPAATVAGGALFGGPIGLAGALASVAFEEATGDDLGGHAIAMIVGDDAVPTDAVGTDDLAALPRSAPTEPDPPATGEAAPAPAAATAAAQLAAAPVPPRVFSGGIPTSALPAIGGAVFIPARAAGAAPPSTSPAAPPSPADRAITAQMMDALAKYEALVQARVGSAPSPGPAPGTAVDSLL